MKLTSHWRTISSWWRTSVHPKEQSFFSITAYNKEGNWKYDKISTLTPAEQLKVALQLDALAQGKSKVSITLCSRPCAGAKKMWFKERDPADKTSSIYIDPDGHEVWICEWLTWQLGPAPILWISVT